MARRCTFILHALQAGCGIKFTLLIQSMYSQLQTCIRPKNCSRSEYFPIKVGTRQECNLSPVIFNLFINKLPLYLDRIATQPCNTGGARTFQYYFTQMISIWRYCHKRPRDLQGPIHGLQTFCSKWKLRVNTQKYKSFIFNPRKISKDSFWLKKKKDK